MIEPRIARLAPLTLVLTLTLAACNGGGGGGSTTPPGPTQPSIARISQPAQDTNVYRDTIFTADPINFQGGVDERTLPGNVKLYNSTTKQAVPGEFNVDGARGNITFAPNYSQGYLAANTKYTFEITGGVRDGKGRAFAPFKKEFTTGGTDRIERPPLARFSKQVVAELPNTSAAVGLVASPNGKYLYGSTLDGQILRWTVDPATGQLGGFTGIYPSNKGGDPTQQGLLSQPVPQAIIGMAFDPNNPNVLWVSHNAPVPVPGQPLPPDFSGGVARVFLDPGGDTSTAKNTVEPYIVGLPRSIRDHLTSSLAFNPKDGFLYLTQGSSSSTGAEDLNWNAIDGKLPFVRFEQLLSATVLKIDVKNYTGPLPINVQTSNGTDRPTVQTPPGPDAGYYNPYAPGEPVTIYADGVRNSYDLVWHSNNSLYLPTNGGAAGGSTPACPGKNIPALQNLPNQDDFLFRATQPGQYFGHPIALRGHCVLNGGNPTAGEDYAEVSQYPVGTPPEWTKPAWDIGPNRSPNGAIEYKGGSLNGSLMVAEYVTGDLLLFKLNTSGAVSAVGTVGDAGTAGVLTFQNPIDIAQTPLLGSNGTRYTYVTEMVANIEKLPDGTVIQKAPTLRVTLLKPAP